MRIALLLLLFGFFPYENSIRVPHPPGCAADNGGLTLAPGFCAAVLADSLKSVRQVTVTPEGIVYAALQRGDNGVVALRDTNGDGRADLKRWFGPAGANDVAMHDGFLYAALPDRIIRWRMTPGTLEPADSAETIVSGLPSDRSHGAKSIAFTGETLYVNVGSPTNSCQERDRSRGSKGIDPCPDLVTRAGIWIFSATQAGQRHSEGIRFATGIRNAAAIGVRPGTTDLFAAVNGRDQLGDNWGFPDAYSAENPLEEVLLVKQGEDYGWPYCYYNAARSLVLAPEYGGDGTEVGRCSTLGQPVMTFPAHWAPLALAFSNGTAMSGDFRDGMFVAFHGSWNRAPLPQQGYRVVFAPFVNGKPSGTYSSFAAGTADSTWLRPTGVAVAPDGAVYISADNRGMIWKIVRDR
jgi:glucose/arabinose dehydrogenase